MKQVKNALSFLDTHRAKIAALLGAVASYLTAVQGSLNTTDKGAVVLSIAAITWKYLAGNSAYEVSQQYNAK